MKPWLQSAQEYLSDVVKDPSLLSSIGDNPFINRMEQKLEELFGLPGHSAIAVSSATAGMAAVLRAMGIGRGDEVIIPALSWGQTLEPVLEVGATPVFVDIEANGVNLDLTQIEAACTLRTKAILAAELFGMPLDWRILDKISQSKKLFTIVDAAQSFGAMHKGPQPTAVVFSFGRGKLICCGEGGAVLCKSAAIYDASLLASQHPIRALQNMHANLPFELVDSVMPNARIHPFAAVLISSGIAEFIKNSGKYHFTIMETREKLEEYGFKPVNPPSGAFQSPPVIPVLTDQPESLMNLCKEHGWIAEKYSHEPLILSSTVKERKYLPAIKQLGFPQRRIKIRHTSAEYTRAMECARRLYIINPLAERCG